MDIGVDARILKYNRRSGVEEYTEKIVERMVNIDSTICFKLLYSNWSGDLNPQPWFYRKNVELVGLKVPNRVLSTSSLLFNWPKLDKVLNVKHFFSPHVLLAPLSSSCRKVTTFHDLSFERFPEFFSFKRRIWHRFQKIAKNHAKLSDHIISVSESTKRDIVTVYGTDPAKISVIYPGVEESISRPTQERLNKFKKEKNVPHSFFLYLGTIEPRKNVWGVVKAFSKIASENEDVKLVIAGQKGWLYNQVFDEIKRSPFKDRIIYLDYISDEDRKYWCSLSLGLVYPSFLEGFGFPVLQAMACQTPVIASRNSSLVEVLGSAGILVDPHNIDDIARAMTHLLSEPLRKELIRRGNERKTAFSWDKAAEQTLSHIIGS